MIMPQPNAHPRSTGLDSTGGHDDGDCDEKGACAMKPTPDLEKRMEYVLGSPLYLAIPFHAASSPENSERLPCWRCPLALQRVWDLAAEEKGSVP